VALALARVVIALAIVGALARAVVELTVLANEPVVTETCAAVTRAMMRAIGRTARQRTVANSWIIPLRIAHTVAIATFAMPITVAGARLQVATFPPIPGAAETDAVVTQPMAIAIVPTQLLGTILAAAQLVARACAIVASAVTGAQHVVVAGAVLQFAERTSPPHSALTRPVIAIPM